MLFTPETATHIIDTALLAVTEHPNGFAEILDRLPAAIYVTDIDGTITYFNRECVALAGRTPALGEDKWCVSWKLFTEDGTALPHDQCPMAVALREGRPIRDVSAVAERPDGTRVPFIPYPTPIFDADGKLAGAVNLLVEVSRKTAAFFGDQAARCHVLAAEANDPAAAGTLALMAAKYEEQALRLRRAPAH
jgi:PAS domain S-box-containing protein